MAEPYIQFQNVSFTYDRAAEPLIQELSLRFPRGWSGVVGANGVGKSTVLKLATGILSPSEGRIQFPESKTYCQQRTDDRPDRLADMILAMDGDAFEIRGRLGIADDWVERWETLSHGERKRAQIGVALWEKPEVLAVDEPTNHLDVDAQTLLRDALGIFRGVGLLVSHDRELLDNLCGQCLFIDPPDAVLRPGKYSDGLLQADREETSLRRERQEAKRDYARLKREASKRRDAAAQSHRRRSKRGLALKDHDARGKINLARVTGKDGVDGKRLNQLEGRLSRTQEKVQNLKVRKTYEMGIWMPGERSKRDTLFRLGAGSLPLGENRMLHFPDLYMKPNDRIALTGINGSGKSTLIGHLMAMLDLPENLVTYIPQEIDLSRSQEIMTAARQLPNEKLGRMMTVVSRLGSRPHRLLESTDPSPGEIRKILLATGIANMPHLIVMDEPTNHLDLPSIECLEDALTGCPCGLLLVSHDQRFLSALAGVQWHISADRGKDGSFTLSVL